MDWSDPEYMDCSDDGDLDLEPTSDADDEHNSDGETAAKRQTCHSNSKASTNDSNSSTSKSTSHSAYTKSNSNSNHKIEGRDRSSTPDAFAAGASSNSARMAGPGSDTPPDHTSGATSGTTLLTSGKVKSGASVSASESNSGVSSLAASSTLALQSSYGSVVGRPDEDCEEVGEDEPYHFEVLGPEQIVADMVETIKEVNQVLQLNPTHTRLLLNHFRWDRERLLERFFEGEPSALFAEAHLADPRLLHGESTPNATFGSESNASGGRRRPVTRSMAHTGSRPNPGTPASSSSISASNTAFCEICVRTLPISYLTGVGCTHRFCVICWHAYLRTKILGEGETGSISCPAFGCDLLADDELVMRMISSDNPVPTSTQESVAMGLSLNGSLLLRRYQHLITESFVACNRHLRWCPAPDCPNAFRVRHPEPRPVRCNCSYQCCFLCGEAWHAPVRCGYLKRWLKKCEDDSETSNWIAANTKECPKCHVTIEKNGGCNHMICKNQHCKHEFCWVCLGAWEPHGSSWYNCNRFDEDEARRARDQQEKSRSALQRYLHYCNRYLNHLQSLRLEHKLEASTREKMQAVQTLVGWSWIEVQFLERAVHALRRCRRTLMYTYVFAYYLRRTNEALIFEDNQKDLEMATEQLSFYLERDLAELFQSPKFLGTPAPSPSSQFVNPAHLNSSSGCSSSINICGLSRLSTGQPLGQSPPVGSFGSGTGNGSIEVSLDTLILMKQRVQDKLRYCEHRRRVLLQHVHDGYERDLWQFSEPPLPL